MATVLRTPAIGAPPPSPRLALISTSKTTAVSFRRRSFRPPRFCSVRLLPSSAHRFSSFVALAASGDTETTEAEVQEPQLADTSDGAPIPEDGAGEEMEETSDSAIVGVLQSYKEAIASNDESKVSEIEAFLQSVEDEKASLEIKVAALSAELSIERDRVLRIGADFDNFRKRTERERLSLVTNAQGEVVENLLPVLDNFERAKAQIKVETEGEEKINNSYQSIYKQFIEILGSLGVVPVETVGNPFDPLLHEAIMREDSTEYEEGIILQEFRKGFKLGDRLLRPSMVKVSAGPGPEKKQEADALSGGSEDAPVEGSEETGSA